MPKGNPQLYEKLIQEVQRCECLYIPSHPQYKDRQRHDAEWTMIGQVLGVSGHEAKKTWQNLRSSYSRCLVSDMLASNSGSPAGKSTWYLKEHMEFLRQHMQIGPLQGIVQSCSSQSPVSLYSADTSTSSLDLSDDTVISEQENGVELPELKMTPPPLTHTMQQKNKKQKLRHLPALDNSLLSALTSRHLLEADDDLEFFKGLLPSVRELSMSNKRKFKRQICNELFDLLETQVQDNDNIQSDQTVNSVEHKFQVCFSS